MTRTEIIDLAKQCKLIVHPEYMTALEAFFHAAQRLGAEQAIKNHALLSALESAKAQMQDGEPHTLTMLVTRKGDAPEQDRAKALQMVYDIRRSLYVADAMIAEGSK